jgi:hypothetical protein
MVRAVLIAIVVAACARAPLAATQSAALGE